LPPACNPITRLIALTIATLVLLACVAPAQAQGIDPEGRLIRDVSFHGLVATPQLLVTNLTNTRAGQPYRAQTIQADIETLEFLNRFEVVQVKVEQNADGSVNVIFEVVELPQIAAVNFTGATRLDEEELRDLVLIQTGDPISISLIDRAVRAVENAYAEEGFFAATITYDQETLAETNELVFNIVEGPRVRVVELRYEGNTVFSDELLDNQVRSDTYSWPFISGFMDRNSLDVDVAAIRKYYRDRGYLNAQVGRRIDLSPRQNRAVVTFVIDEGQQYTVRDIEVRFLQDGVQTDDQLMSEQQIRYVLYRGLVRGGEYSDQRLMRSQEAIRIWYGEIGFINTDVTINRVFDNDLAVVDVVVEVTEGAGPTIVGDVMIIGLDRTQQKVLLRRLTGMEPGRPYNLSGMEQSRQLVQQSIWFNDGIITLLGDENDAVRDVLIDANERNTGTFSIGLGVSSDLGFFGAISMEQRNFDIADWPESWDEFLNQRAFLGAGQTFNVTLAPGNENSTYAVGFREPYLFESDYFLDLNASAVQSSREDFDEGRTTFRSGIGRRLGDVWTGSARMRLEQIQIDNIEPSAPTDVFASAGDSQLTSLGFTLVRSTTDSNITPSQGSRVTLSVNQIGLIGGDYDFTRIALGYNQFWTIDEDFMGRKTIVSFDIDTGYIPQDTSDVPVFERFYSGGRDFRGFAYRGAGPRGIRNDNMLLGEDPVGGRFQFITRLQYEFPVYEKFVRWAIFTDQGTVQDDIGFDEWRVTVGTGIRLTLPFFGQAPIAIDLGIPLIEQEGDQTQLISFNIEFPFN